MITRKAEQALSQREHMRGGAGTVELNALVSQLPANLRLFSTIRLTPGTSIGYHVHEHETELFYFLSGQAIVDDNGAKARVGVGDALATCNGQGHAVENDGSEDVLIVAVIVKDPA